MAVPVKARVIGAGLAGLSAAVRLVDAGASVAIADSAAQAGGRCRSYFDPQLGQTIDNGNHLVLSGNSAVTEFRDLVGAASATLLGPPHADFDFHDLHDGSRWAVRINDGPVPWWTLVGNRRVPGTRWRDYLPLGKLLANRAVRIDTRVKTSGPLWKKFLEPVLLAALNTAPGESSARLAAGVLRETIAKGGQAMRPCVAEPTLAAAFIDPATAWLAARGSAVMLGKRLRAIEVTGEYVTGLDWGAGVDAVAADDAVVLAVPPWVAVSLLPDITVPDDFRAIVNGHFAFTDMPTMAHIPRMLGVLGGTAEWVFAFHDRISVTVSAADHLVDTDREELARLFWADICAAHAIDAPLPPWQIVKERRATFAATPEQDAKRPPSATRWRNLFLAGDWTQTGLPATIEGAIRSGVTAAGLATARALV